MKFRVWGIKENEYVQDVLHLFINEDGDLFELDDTGYEVALIRLSSDEYIIEQSTGLKSRKWEDVYEGDILRFLAKNEYEKENFVSYEIFFHDNDCANQHIGFQMDRLHFNGNLCGGSKLAYVLPKYISKMEVIGNIHENKELLNEI